ncbi:MAG: ATP-dependent zinc metalloprotease FtsH [Desulfobacteraceae bacterium]|nr:ATP-dependent zinc metalloprotease FtsH [Desulfobacteraceae bacterium]
MNREIDDNRPTGDRQSGSSPWQPWNAGQENSYRMWIFLAAVLLLLGWSMYASRAGPEKIKYTTFLQQLNSANVAQVTIKGDKITGSLKEKAHKPADQVTGAGGVFTGKDSGQDNGEKGPAYKKFVTYLPSFGDPDLMDVLQSQNVAVETEPESDTNWWYLIFTLLPFVILGWLIYSQFRQFQGQGGEGLFSIGKSKARLYDRSQESTSFDDVAGAEGAKTELAEVVSFLKEPSRIRDLGASVPKGVMLVGPPGTGKTLLARAVAGEADVPFFSITGSDFMEMFVGVGAKRVRSLFADAKKNAPGIIFIDEMDAIGRRRGAGLGGGHDEREQTLNQLLSELDGFEENENVIVMCATNRPDVLDPALMRPGRFDRRIIVDLPTTADRRKILGIYAGNKRIGGDVDLDALARGTPGFSGADLENMLNEAALLAARREKKIIDNEDIEEARDKILMGLVRQGLALTEEEKQMVAYHEAGHAVVGASLKYSDPVYKVSIVPRSLAMGATQQFPEGEKYIYHRQYLADRLAVMMGGRAAEMLVFDTATSGAGNDLQNATQIARQMVLEWGMSGRFEHMALGSKSGEVFLGEELAKTREYSEDTAREVDQEVESLLSHAFSRAKKILEENREAMDKLAEILVEKEEVPGARVYELLGRNPSY